MPSLYTENEDRWKHLADIDYFTYYAKAWITFNAWYKNHFPLIDTDRAAINEIKSNNNSIKSRFMSLIGGSNEESEVFKSHLGFLHYTLLNNEIRNDEQRIYFENFVFELDRSCLTQTQSYNGIAYYVKLTLSHGQITQVQATVRNSAGTTILNYNHAAYDFGHFVLDSQYQRLSKSQQNYVNDIFKKANPKKPVSLMITNPSDPHIKIGQFMFIHDNEKLFKALIEILYSLRNVLFHGQIIPDKNTNKVYEPAYKVLRMLIN